MLKFVFTNLAQALKDIEADKTRTRKAAETAVRVEGYRLMQRLKDELREGRAGANVFDPLTEIGKAYGKPVNRKPLSRLAVAVRYSAERVGDNYVVGVGFLNAGRKAISKSWLKIAEFQQTGGVLPIGEERRRGILSIGISRRKRKDPTAKYFFLKPATQTARVPARDIVTSFIQARRGEMDRNIVDNFERKMRGERI